MSEKEIGARLLDKQMVHIADEKKYVLKGRLPGTGSWYYSQESHFVLPRKYATRREATDAIEKQRVTWVKERGEEADDV